MIHRVQVKREKQERKRLLSIQEAAEYLGRSVEAVKMMTKRGQIPVTILAHRRQYDKRKLDKVIERATRDVAPDAALPIKD